MHLSKRIYGHKSIANRSFLVHLSLCKPRETDKHMNALGDSDDLLLRQNLTFNLYQ